MGQLESEANENSGIVQATIERLGEFQLHHVAWRKVPIWSSELRLESGFASFEATEWVASIERGERVEATHAGHEMLYQYHIFTHTDGDKSYGISACFYCDRSQKGFSVITLSNAISAKEDILEDFMDFMSSFVCH